MTRHRHTYTTNPQTSAYQTQLVDIKDCTNLQQVHEKTQILDPTEKVQLYTTQQGRWETNNGEFGDYMGLRNSVTKQAYGICKPGYEIIQNSTAFAVLEEIVQAGDANFDKCGVWNNGASCYITVHNAEASITSQTDSNDTIKNNLFALGDSSGSWAHTFGNHSIRLWCLNQLPAMQSWLKNQTKFRHTKSASKKLDAMNSLMRISNAAFDTTIQAYQTLSDTSMRRPEFHTLAAQLLEEVWPGGVKDKEEWQGDTNWHTYTTHRANQMMNLDGRFIREPNTKWGALQAITGWRDHDPSKNYFSNMRGVGAKFKTKALHMLQDPSQVATVNIQAN